VMIHRTVLGAMERFMGTLIEHYAGAFPVWLAPTQVSLLPVLERNEGYAGKVYERLRCEGIRAEVVGSQQKLGFRIRAKTMEKVPYIIVVGDKEEESASVSVRKRKHGDQGSVPLEDFINGLKEEISKRLPDS
jgi:threonyl-tRNA synthetase